jgi:hypothetical protein
MQSRICSRTASRRNSGGDSRVSRVGFAPRLGLLLALLLLAAADLGAQDLSLTVSRDSLLVSAGIVFRWDRQAELFSTLREGLESRITFTLRAFEKTPGMFAFLGDRLLAERTIARSAFFNFLDGTYVVEDDAGARATYTDLGALLKGFFTVEKTALARLRPERLAPCYVVARAQFDPVRLMPPLSIVSLAGAAATHTTAWVREEMPK